MTLNRRQMVTWLAALPVGMALWRFSEIARADAPAAAEEPMRDPGFTTNPMNVIELAPGLSLLSGPGGNITVLNKGDGSLIVDSGIPPRGAEIVAGATKAAGDALPRTVINTHWHYDHVGGNSALVKAGVQNVIAHDNTLVRMSSPQRIATFNMDFPAAPKEARPTLTFADSITLHRDGEEIKLLYFAPAHTDSDIAVFYQNANVVQTGDLFFNEFYPFIDYSSGGSIEGMIAATEKLLTMVDDKTKIVPGHGAVGNKADLTAFHDMLVTARDRLKPMIATGISLADLQAKKPLADLDEKWGQRMFHGSNFVHVIYAGMTAEKK